MIVVYKSNRNAIAPAPIPIIEPILGAEDVDGLVYGNDVGDLSVLILLEVDTVGDLYVVDDVEKEVVAEEFQQSPNMSSHPVPQ